MTLNTIARGIRLILTGDLIYSAGKKMIAGANVENDACDIDSDLADCIVQAGVLGELVYG